VQPKLYTKKRGGATVRAVVAIINDGQCNRQLLSYRSLFSGNHLLTRSASNISALSVAC